MKWFAYSTERKEKYQRLFLPTQKEFSLNGVLGGPLRSKQIRWQGGRHAAPGSGRLPPARQRRPKINPVIAHPVFARSPGGIGFFEHRHSRGRNPVPVNDKNQSDEEDHHEDHRARERPDKTELIGDRGHQN